MTSPVERYHNMTAHLGKLYEVPLFERDGVVHPVVAYPADASQRADVDSVLGRLDADAEHDFAFYNYAHLATLQNSGRNLFNGVTFDMLSLRHHPLRIDAQYGRYFDMLATCGALDHELRAAAERTFIRLPQRSQLHRMLSPGRSLVDGRGRSATIGGLTLIVYARDGGYRAMLARRSLRAAVDPGFYHALPAYIVQPLTYPAQPVEWSLTHHIFREVLEELFGMPEAPAEADPAHFDDHPALADLRAMLDDGRAGLYLAGVVLNLLMLRPEIATLLLIHDADWWPRISAPGSATPLNAHAEAHGGQIIHLPLDAPLADALPADYHTLMPPQALAGVHLSLELARDLVRHAGGTRPDHER